MAKNWAEFRQPSRADGFTEGAQLSAQQRAATKGQICACTFSRVLASALASRTNFRGSSRTVTKNLCWQSCRTHTCAANFWHAMQQCKGVRTPMTSAQSRLSKQYEKIGQSSGSPAGLMAWRRVKTDTILFQFCSAESWPPLWNCTNRPLRLWPSYKRLRSYELQASIAKFELKHSWCNEHSQTFFCQKPWQQKKESWYSDSNLNIKAQDKRWTSRQPTFAYNPTCGSQHPSFKRFALPAGCTCALMRHILRSRNPAREMGAKSAPLQQGLLSTTSPVFKVNHTSV